MEKLLLNLRYKDWLDKTVQTCLYCTHKVVKLEKFNISELAWNVETDFFDDLSPVSDFNNYVEFIIKIPVVKIGKKNRLLKVHVNEIENKNNFRSSSPETVLYRIHSN